MTNEEEELTRADIKRDIGEAAGLLGCAGYTFVTLRIEMTTGPRFCFAFSSSARSA